MGRVRIVIDKSRCQGTGVCVLRSPGIFDQSSTDGKVFVIENANLGENIEEIREAVFDCPSQALSLVEGNGEERKSISGDRDG